MRKAVLLGAALLLVLAVSACGSKATEVNVEELADKLLEQVDFEDELTEVDSGMVATLYGIEGAEEQKVYMSSGATTEEIAVFRFATEKDAQTGLDTLSQRLESRKEDYANYMPDEGTRLENAVLKCSGCYVALCVSSGDEAQQIIGEYLG